jgi:hypothetical protein
MIVALSARYAVKVGIYASPTVFTSMIPAVKRGIPSILIRDFSSSRGQGDRGGWPSTTGNSSGDGRSNNPPTKLTKKKDRDNRGRHIKFQLHSIHRSDHMNKKFNEQVTCIACGGNATIMLYESGITSMTTGLTKKLCNSLKKRRQKSLPPPEYVALGSRGRYYVRFTDGKSDWVGCEKMKKELIKANRSVKSVAFGNHKDSYFIVYKGGSFSYNKSPQELEKLISSRKNKNDLECVSLGPDGEFYMSAKNGPQRKWWGGISKKNLAKIEEVRNRGIKFIDFGGGHTFLCRYT